MSPVFDPADEGFQALVDLFVQELPQRVDAVRDALRDDDLAAARRVAHQLKGSAGCYGFNEITAPAAGLQAACDRGAGREELAAAAARLGEACGAAAARRAAEPV